MIRSVRTSLAIILTLLSASATHAQSAVGASRLLTVTPQEFLQTCRADIARAKSGIDQFKRPNAARDAMAGLDVYDSAIGVLGDTGARAGLARNVHPDVAMRDAASSCESEVEKAGTDFSLDRGLYDRLSNLDVSAADAATRYYVTTTLRDFRRAGVDRDEATRRRISELRERLVALGQQFAANVAKDVRSIEFDPADLDGLPEDYKRAHPAGANGKVRLTTSNTDYQPFLTYARSSTAREAYWKLYRQRGSPDNLTVLSEMLERRAELARLLGFDTWADYITGDKMIATRPNAAKFIADISAAADERMKREYQEILDWKRRDTPNAPRVDAWDSANLQEQVKVARFNFDSQTVRPYFEYSRVKQGVLDLTSRMFRITYRPVKDAAVWHPDVEAYDVLDGTRVLGRIYLDMFPRENKYTHYAQFTLTNGKEGRQLPEGVLVCNFPKPGTAPALMTHGDVETMFHEFGHLLHHVLGGHTRWVGISGVDTEWDFVEAPSQMLEEWVWTPETLQTFARHYETNQPIPAEMVARMKAADEFGKGLYVRQQMFYAAISLELHSRDPRRLNATRVVAELQEQYTPFRFVEDTFFEASFTHLDGYSAIYYTYMWSLVIAKDLFTVFAREGLLNADTAARYRRAVLEPGGSKPAADLVDDFLGRPYSFEAYRDWINRN